METGGRQKSNNFAPFAIATKVKPQYLAEYPRSSVGFRLVEPVGLRSVSKKYAVPSFGLLWCDIGRFGFASICSRATRV
jgi:hypothetical protein